MDSESFFKALYSPFLSELASLTPNDIQNEIARCFLVYFGEIKDGNVYILEGDALTKLSVEELSEELPFLVPQIEEFLSLLKIKHLNTHFSYNGLFVQKDKHWTIGGISSIFRDILSGKTTSYTFPISVEFSTDIGVKCTINVTLTNVKGEGVYLKAVPNVTSTKECSKKYTGYYASLDGSMDASVVINKFDLNFNLGNVLKYIIRAGKKDPSKHIEDLEKAKKYIEFEIDKLNGQSI